MMENKVITKYILFKIYSNTWKAGQRIPSKKSLAIRFDVSTSVIFNILNVFKKNGLLVATERKGYYVSNNTETFYFYSITEFSGLNKIVKSKFDVQYHVPDDFITKMVKADQKSKQIIQDYKVISRKYWINVDQKQKLTKISYLLFSKTIFSNLIKIKDLQIKPLYEYLAWNGFLITSIRRLWFYATFQGKRYWTNIELVYDIDHNLIFINIIYNIDHGDAIVAVRTNSLIFNTNKQ